MDNFNIGDRLVREKGFFFSKHHVLYAGKNNEGIEIVAENQVGFGVRFITLFQFLNEGKLVRVEKFEGDFFDREVILQRILQLIGTTYHLTDFNCEHFCNYILFGKKESKQIQNASVILGMTAVVGWMFNSSSKQEIRRRRRRRRA